MDKKKGKTTMAVPQLVEELGAGYGPISRPKGTLKYFDIYTLINFVYRYILKTYIVYRYIDLRIDL